MDIIENDLKMKLKALWAWQLKVGVAMYVGVVIFVIPPHPPSVVEFQISKKNKKATFYIVSSKK